jgi:tetratricopeptide (TPR) repeat protein
MEYVEGLPITEHCDHRKLTIENRLSLFQQVCLAVHHAHQKGIIHRDIKPSNILVSIQGDQVVPKIIDFGVAKAISQLLTEKTLLTEQGQLFGTPEYMSPEQADMAGEDIDTRSDIYSLGVLLYVLLTGVLPFDSDTLRTGGIEHIRQVIRESNPKTPNTRLMSLGEEAEEVAKSRRTEVETLARRLHKELEWIPLKAMRKERAERYRSASELADDIENYLIGVPLIAGPPSTIYRLKKSVRRHKALVAGSLAVLAVSLIGMVVSTIFAIGQGHALAEAQAVSDFLRFSVLESLDPFKVGGRQINIRSVLDAASKDLQDKFQGTLMAEAEIRHTIGFAYWSLGLYKQHELHYRRAVDICRAHLGNEDPKTLLWVKELGWGYFHQSRFDEAEKLFSEAVKGMRRVLGTEDERMLHSMTSLGIVYCMQGRFDEAEELCVTAFDICRRRYKEADDLYQRGLQISLREYGEHDFYTLAMKRDFGALHHKLGRYGQAEALMREALAGWQDAWGWEHQETLLAMAALGGLYRSQGRYDAAEALLAEAVEIARRVLHETHTTIGDCMHRLGAVYLSQGKYDEAELLLDEALETARRLLGKENWATLSVKNTLAKLYEAQERYEMADSLFNETLEGRLSKLGEDHPDTLETKNDLAVLYMKQARYDDAEPLLLEALKGRRLKLGDTHPHTLASLNGLIDLYEAWGKPEQVKQWQAQLPID